MEAAAEVGCAALGRRPQVTSLATLLILAVAPIVVCYLASWYQFRHLGPTDNPHHATNGQDGHPMPRVMAGTALERVTRWVEDGSAVFESACRMLHEYDQLKKAADAAQEERERLQQTCDAWRAEVRQLQADIERARTARADTAQWFSAMIKETAARLRIEPENLS
jgi:hypothetical protein